MEQITTNRAMKRIAVGAMACLAIVATQPVSAEHHESAGVAQKAVLITGASSGLGRTMTERLSAEGYFIYAGARKDKDLAELNAMENVEGVRLDVTIQSDIDAAVKQIRGAGRGLHGLVNNAGVAVISPLTEIDEDDFDFQMDVNVYGPYRITRAFAPMIIESKGRITTISSISGVLAGATWGPYSMSKHAIEAFGDSLADEMSRFGVHVSLIEPGTYATKIGDNAAARMQQRGQKAESSELKEEMAEAYEWLTDYIPSSGDPNEVADAALHALFDDNPKHRYLVVPNQEQAEWVIRQAIKELVQFNQQHKYSYDREALMKILDEELAVDN
jgi:NAD(P)-dependent dehydrogenase (short-subunit alcohol dehydrogenase family)